MENEEEDERSREIESLDAEDLPVSNELMTAIRGKAWLIRI